MPRQDPNTPNNAAEGSRKAPLYIYTDLQITRRKYFHSVTSEDSPEALFKDRAFGAILAWCWRNDHTLLDLDTGDFVYRVQIIERTKAKEPF